MFLDDNMSNLTSASNEAASLSSSQHSTFNAAAAINSAPLTSTSNNQSQTNKKKRNLPGNPDPEAEVIAMSPKTLMATNRFVCEICSKGFQRDQNLQLHRRGHNLPWKLKQRSKQEVVRKKVYVCPEPSCVHHEAARALGDLTGIKKHYSRKHGEKKWKCEKCSKRYAVQSDWKAHSKICGTREYRCDCGTLFSRRDSFITHRAFCGALAGEAARSSSSTLLAPNHQLPLHLPLNFPLKTEPHLFQYPQLNPNIMTNDIRQNNQIPSWFVNHHHPNPNNGSSNNLDFTSSTSSSCHMSMSATALLQKAAQIGETMSKHAGSTNSVIVMSQQQQQQQHQSILSGSHQHSHMCAPTSTTLFTPHHASGLENLSSTDDNQQDLLGLNGGFGNDQQSVESINAFQEAAAAYNSFQEAFFPQTASASTQPPPLNPTNGANGNDELTRDFLGLTAGDQQFLSMAGLDQLNTSSSYHNHQLQHHDPNHNQNQLPWDG
ncbi:hypothetical protein QVD17_01810 [Tagetes erecta]|uniref:C2H2-type domain-containing protein n=1 Tax=Tagetes erecta TaxID=13708 RepID=A0AAD8P1U2_TARER|nr:hypothetical protein QVD17_01810 [Tagetes erecta]